MSAIAHRKYRLAPDAGLCRRLAQAVVATALLSSLASCVAYKPQPCPAWPLDPPVATTCAASTEAGYRTHIRLEHLSGRRWRLIVMDLENPLAQDILFADLARRTCPSGFRRTADSTFTVPRPPDPDEQRPSTGVEREPQFQRYFVWQFECPKDEWTGEWPSLAAP